MDKNARLWQEMCIFVEQRGMKIVAKERVWWWWVAYYIGFIFLWNPKFMKTTTTVAGSTIYMPELTRNNTTSWMTLAHEYVHKVQRDRTGGLVHGLKTGFPQYLAVLGALGFLGLVWWPLYFLFLLTPLFLFPLVPATWRIDVEEEATVMNMAIERWAGRAVLPGSYWMDLLCGGIYLYPQGLLRTRSDRARERSERAARMEQLANKAHTLEPYAQVYAVVAPILREP